MSKICLTTDGWSNIQNKPIVNYICVSPESSFFLESVSTNQQDHNHTFIAEDIARVFWTYELTQFYGALNDKTATNKKSWGLLRQMFSSCYFQGCCSHGIHLFVKDIFSATKTKNSGSTKEMNMISYLFGGIIQFILDRKMSSSFFTTKTLWKQNYKSFKIEPVEEFLYDQHLLVEELFRKCFRACWIPRGIFLFFIFCKTLQQRTLSKKSERIKVKATNSDDQFVIKLKRWFSILVQIEKLIVK